MQGHGGKGCADLVEELHSLVEGELDPVRAAEIRGHMERCAPCRAYLESASATRDALGGMGRRPELTDEERACLEECMREVVRRMGR